MPLHPPKTIDLLGMGKSVVRLEFFKPVLLAMGMMCGMVVFGGNDSKGVSDPLTGNTAGEQRSFELGHGVHLNFRWAPAGKFMMGSPDDDPGKCYGEHQRMAEIKEGFWIAEVETTVSAWRRVMNHNPTSKDTNNEMPVAGVSWHDCREFLNRLQSPGRGWRYELPTEAQWEYACRAGWNSVSPRSIAELGWINANSDGRTHPVGGKPANAWSLHDMHGNVAEWCLDTPGDRNNERAIKGGSWDSDLTARAAARNSDTPFLRINRVGFRLVLVRE